MPCLITQCPSLSLSWLPSFLSIPEFIYSSTPMPLYICTCLFSFPYGSSPSLLYCSSQVYHMTIGASPQFSPCPHNPKLLYYFPLILFPSSSFLPGYPLSLLEMVLSDWKLYSCYGQKPSPGLLLFCGCLIPIHFIWLLMLRLQALDPYMTHQPGVTREWV